VVSTLSVSPSASLSFVKTLPVMAESSLPEAASAFAVGPGLLTLSVKPC
jgi:hypothetical protein